MQSAQHSQPSSQTKQQQRVAKLDQIALADRPNFFGNPDDFNSLGPGEGSRLAEEGSSPAGEDSPARNRPGEGNRRSCVQIRSQQDAHRDSRHAVGQIQKFPMISKCSQLFDGFDGPRNFLVIARETENETVRIVQTYA
ncbi:uncharacterized protein N7477_005209 [Penicillium maclennaniae]|uniref:uncharacterized protein n=1 Tax=Penicillium maclennaniae TaxID=1343394 RepID=UPI0025410B97|nr:uncharacterized protein N7477_005209 [Penicillium maclennaniae]KAJ5675275.1 hypothetical protein N7477_005209 [Penicillium maclennaniae]